ncbi:MAG: hypothetical protein EOO02_14850 [Chitinophagaceae bacterium]|nr:MAG: hypothetical protein EOO02_14850 [Chitinophagaceae bacterium]
MPRPIYRSALTILTLILCSLAHAQSNYFQVKKVKTKELNFPIFSGSVNVTVTKNINELLQLSELQLLEGHQQNNIFENVSVDRGTIYGGKVNIDYTVLSNNSKLLSVKFDEASCGATCTYWVQYYNFNAGNGSLIQLSDLFTKNGFSAFRDLVLKRRTRKFKQEIQQLDSNTRDMRMAVLSGRKQ